MRILVVDDEENNRILLLEMLRAHGYEVVMANNGREALEVARSSGVDLIISDIMMPEMDGFDLCRHVKRDDTLRALPFVFYTATYTEAQDERLAMELGASRFIIKPMEADAFIKEIQQVIEKHEAEKLEVPTQPAQDVETLDALHLQSVTKKLMKKVQQLEDALSALEKSEEQYRTLFESASDAILLLDGDRFVDCNARALEMLRCTREQLIGQTPQWLSPERQPDGSLSTESSAQRFAAAFRGEPQFFEWRTLRTDGSLFDAEVNLNRIEVSNRAMVLAQVRDVTDRKRAAEELRESEMKLNAIFDHHFQFTGLLDVEGRILAANRTALDFAGVDESQVVGQCLCNTPWWDDQQRLTITSAIKRATQGEFVRFECTHVRSDGAVRDFDFSLSPVRDDDGNVVYLVPEGRDITDRKAAEEKLGQSEERFRSLFEDALDMIHIVDTNGAIIDANRAELATLGYTREEYIGKPLAEVIHPDRRQDTLQAARSVLSGEAVRGYETVLITKSGEPIDVEISAAPQVRDGEVVAARAIMRDVRERKRAEEQLREHDAMIRALVETSRDWIWAIDLRGIHTYSSPAVEAILGYRPEELVGKPSFDLIHEEDRKAVETELPKWIAEKRGWNRLALRWRHKDGSWRYLESNALPILAAGGEITGFRGVDRDITERIEADEKLAGMDSRLAHVARLSTMGEMVAGIAHEVSQPLYAIVNYARATKNILKAEGEQDLGHLREWNAAIADAAKLASDVVRRMRKFARRGQADYSICSINDIVHESVQLVAFEARRRDATVHLELPEASSDANVDRVQIQPVLVNLLRNAFEAMDEAESEVREVTIRVEPAKESIQVSVVDTGPGLPALDDLDVFEAFATNKKDGLGLGLAISNSIIEAHDGKLWADSSASGGAAFRFTLPAFKEEFTDDG